MRTHCCVRCAAASERAQRPSAAPSRDATEQRFQLTSYFTFYFCSAKSTPPRARTKEVSTAPGLPSLRLACLTHARCPAPCTRAHAKQSTLDTHAARMRASTATRTCTHTATCTCAHTRQKHHVVPRVTGNWLTVGRPAAEPSSTQLQCKCACHVPLLASHVHHPHVVHATHHHCCHRTAETHDDNERDEDERHDAEDREHDGRSQRVRARSRLPLSRAKAHAHARCQAPLSKTRTLPSPRWPWNDHPFDAQHVVTVGGPNRAIGRPSTTRITTCSCS